MFTKGMCYTRLEINQKIGGSVQSFLPTVNGEVVCACLTEELNPQAPEVILAGNGPRIIANAEKLGRQRAPLPVFMKQAANAWEYVGDWRPVRATTDRNEIAAHSAKAGRNDVRVVVFMEP